MVLTQSIFFGKGLEIVCVLQIVSGSCEPTQLLQHVTSATCKTFYVTMPTNLSTSDKYVFPEHTQLGTHMYLNSHCCYI